MKGGENMKFKKEMPFKSVLENNDKLEVGLWQSDKNVCEYSSEYMADPTDTEGVCDDSSYYYGTTDEREPMFCARHFYQIVVYGFGKTEYTLDR